MRCLVSAGMQGLLRNANDTVVLCTPAASATSRWVTRRQIDGPPGNSLFEAGVSAIVSAFAGE
jgi:hypothetical protein